MMKKKNRPFTFFQFFTFAVLFIFMGVMSVVAVTAFTRKSGATGLSMTKIQKMRFEIAAKKSQQEAGPQ